MKPMQTSLVLLFSAVVGGGFAVFLDPRAGRRRRARAWQTLDHAMNSASRGISVAARDLHHRVHGIASVARGVTTTHEVADDVVAARLRSRLGHACAHPHALRVTCRGGVAELSGPILRGDVSTVLQVARGTLGVRHVTDRLERHDTPAGIPGLRGVSRTSRMKRGAWAPALRLVVGGSGAIATVAGMARGGALGLGAAALGTAAIVRSLTNIPFAELAGVGGRRPAFDIEKTTTIHAPVEEVFELFVSPDKLARVMRHATTVERIGENRWHWKVRGVGGSAFEWDGFFERLVPNKLAVWRSVGGAPVQHVGSARFERLGPSTTRVAMRLRYWPSAGLAGHDLARLLGEDPKRELEEDMLRLKSLLEQGRTTGPLGTITLEDVRGSV